MTETKKGKWIKGKFNFIKRMYEPCEDNAVYGVKYICSECNNTAYSDSDWGERLFPYCPFCGAEMENGDDDL
jgi:rubrerythrin